MGNVAKFNFNFRTIQLFGFIKILKRFGFCKKMYVRLINLGLSFNKACLSEGKPCQLQITRFSDADIPFSVKVIRSYF